ncbi:DUF2207 domain-containing protein [Aestuariivirga sp.]|uniref:DUF2207 domain-containing protein n=1 Tax=Aestuariivirga sp. TaxID=2650926 RepID=UPI003593A2C1
MRFLAFVFGLVFALATPVLADERITGFLSDVTVNADASLTVRETISVIAEGRDIRRGIFRDIPTIYKDRLGQRVVVGLDVVDVKRDGRSEPYAIEAITNGKRIRIGDKDVLLDDGQHVYQVTYRTTRQIGFFDDYDELYWNVTGNGWDFAIDEARITIRLPPGANIRQHAEYTGYQGEGGKDSRVLNDSDGVYSAETTRRLLPKEGFTVAVAWQKGIVAPPTDSEKWSWWLSDNAGLFALAFSLLASAAYFLYAWDKVGRDPPKGTIIPLFKPPQDLGPASVRYITQYGMDDRTFAAAMVGLAVKGRLNIHDDDKSFTVTKLSAPASAEALTAPESALYQALSSGSTELKQANRVKVQAAKSALQNALDAAYDGTIFQRNLMWFTIGLGISAACLILAALFMPADEGFLGLLAVGWTTVWWGFIIAIAWASLKGLMRERGVMKKIASLFGLLFLIPFMGGGLAGPVMVMAGGGSAGLYMLIGTAVLLGIMNVVFFYLLRAPTEPGRKLMDQIEGFRMYLSTAEENRLNVLHPPEKTPELFERYLPYALALNCENEWNAKFAAVLAAAAAAGASAPLWYSGTHWDSGRTGGFTDSLGSGLSSSVASASTAPGRSSGSGGGGSSGGGGGGGGGGGW